MKYKILLPAAFFLSAHCATAVLIASDGFDDGTFSDPAMPTTANGNGIGWKANTWTAVGSNVEVTSGEKQAGTHSATIPNGSGRYIERTLDLTDYENVAVSFFWAHRFMEAGEKIDVKFDGGSGFTTAGTVTAGSSGNPLEGFFSASFNLDTSSLTGTTHTLRFETRDVGGTDFFFVDTIEVNGDLVPEPSSALLGALGVLGLLLRRR